LLEILSILVYNYPNHPLLQQPIVARISRLLLSRINAGAIQTSTASNIGAGMMITGALIRVLTYRYLGRLFTFSLSIHRDHYLVTSGPYSIVRHPAYTGLLIGNSGWFLWHLSRGSFFMSGLGLERTLLGKAAVGLWGVSTMGGILYATLGRLREEDDVIKREFGKEWDEWARRVPYMLIPGIY
jgi:protein-S-isoprenylcysteine O-methyltransferase Ste14